MELKFLGRGSAFNTNELNNSAYVIDEDSLLLIDCGEDIFKEIVRQNLLDNIKNVNVLITHLHSGHVGSLSSLIYYCYFVKQIEIKIYFGSLQKLNQEKEGIYEYNFNSDLINFLKFSVNDYKEMYGHVLFDKDYVLTDNIKIINSLKVNHCDNMSSYGYLLDLAGQIIYYSGDSKEIPSIILDKFKNGEIDKIYQDTSLSEKTTVHLSINDLEKLILKELQNKVYCMHCEDYNKLEEIIKERDLKFNIAEANR